MHGYDEHSPCETVRVGEQGQVESHEAGGQAGHPPAGPPTPTDTDKSPLFPNAQNALECDSVHYEQSDFGLRFTHSEDYVTEWIWFPTEWWWAEEYHPLAEQLETGHA